MINVWILEPMLVHERHSLTYDVITPTPEARRLLTKLRSSFSMSGKDGSVPLFAFLLLGIAERDIFVLLHSLTQDSDTPKCLAAGRLPCSSAY